MKTRKRIKLFGDYGILYLGSHEFLFDSEDYDLIRNRDWYRDKDGYLVNCYYFNGRRNFTRFHRIIMNAKPKQFVDHINRNRAEEFAITMKIIRTVAFTQPTSQECQGSILIKNE